MSGGFVYVIEFGNGTIKVGHSQAIAQRLQTHKRTARSFGLAVSRCWESPCHDSFRRNEDALKRIARELGGTPTTAEYFYGVSFDALVERARELPFPPPPPAPPPAPDSGVTEASAPQAAPPDDAAVKQATIRAHAEREALMADIAFWFIECGVTPAVMRHQIGNPSLADDMDLLLNEEAKIRREMGAPAPSRPFIGARST